MNFVERKFFGSSAMNEKVSFRNRLAISLVGAAFVLASSAAYPQWQSMCDGHWIRDGAAHVCVPRSLPQNSFPNNFEEPPKRSGWAQKLADATAKLLIGLGGAIAGPGIKMYGNGTLTQEIDRQKAEQIRKNGNVSPELKAAVDQMLRSNAASSSIDVPRPPANYSNRENRAPRADLPKNTFTECGQGMRAVPFGNGVVCQLDPSANRNSTSTVDRSNEGNVFQDCLRNALTQELICPKTFR